MHRLIETSTSFFGTGIPPGEKLFKVKSGSFANRMIAVFPESADLLVFAWADPPYSEWSDPQTITDTYANLPVSAVMDGYGNLYVVFTSATNFDLKFVKLSFNAGVWTVGTIRTICNAGDNYYPSIVREDGGRLWVSWCYFDTGTTEYTIRIKNSDDDGANWGTGPADIGTALSTASGYIGYTGLALTSSHIHAAYWANQTGLYTRNLSLSGGDWSDEFLLRASDNMENHFCIASSPDNKVGVAFVNRSDIPGMRFKEHDGTSWSGFYQVDFSDSYSPALRYLNGTPYIFFTVKYGEDQYAIKYSFLSDGAFTTPQYFIEGMKVFDKVFLYDDDAPSKFCDRTTAAASPDIVADVFHPASSAMIDANEDILYLGMDKPFYFFKAILSTVGADGVVTYAYWNGSEWDEFVPYSGAYNFYTSPQGVFLWADGHSIPPDWQKNGVNGISKFWIKIEVTSSFSTPPVGSQITAIPDCEWLNIIANI